MVCFGNKSDLCPSSPEIDKARKELLKVYPEAEKIVHLEGSAKLGHNISQIF